MPNWLAWTLLGVFAAHLLIFLLIFLRLYVGRRDRYYALVCLTCVLLEVTFSLSIFDPALSLAGVARFWYTRVAAWVTALIRLTWFVRRRRRRLQTSAQEAYGNGMPSWAKPMAGAQGGRCRRCSAP